MSESLAVRTWAVNRHEDFGHSVLAELIARRLKQDRSYFTLNEQISRCAAGGLVVAAAGSQCHGVALALTALH